MLQTILYCTKCGTLVDTFWIASLNGLNSILCIGIICTIYLQILNAKSLQALIASISTEIWLLSVASAPTCNFKVNA